MQYWLMKSEPDCFSIDDLINEPKQTTHWDGVRNYQARNMMRDQMKPKDLVFFYHSNTNPPGIAGIAEVASEGYPDHTAFDPNSDHPDPKSDPNNPRWYMVDLKFQQKFNALISLHQLKSIPFLQDMKLLQKGNRLSVMPIAKEHWDFIIELSQA